MALLRGTILKNLLKGTTGDDMLVGLGGDDTLIGGAGIDTAWYSGNRAGYAFSSEGGKLVVRDILPADGSDGRDVLSQIERLQFGDVQMNVSTVSEFQVNTTSAYNQVNPTLTTLADGDFLISWETQGPDPVFFRVFAQRFDANGQAEGAEFQVNSVTDSNQRSDSTSEGLSNGGYVVAWDASGNQDGSGYGVFARLYDPTGAAVGSDFQVNTSTTNQQSNPTIAALVDGGFVVSWLSWQNNIDTDIYAQRFDAGGAMVGMEFLVNSYTSGGQAYPTIAALASGGFAVAWFSDGQDGSGGGVYARVFDAGGMPINTFNGGIDFRVNTTTTGNQDQPAIAALDNGGFVVTWHDDSSSLSRIMAQLFAAGGAAVGTEIQVTASGYPDSPVITGVAGGGFVISWEAFDRDGSESGIFAQRYDANGNAVGTDFQVNTYTSSYQADPTIAALDDGGFVVSWRSIGQDGDQSGIFAQRYDAHGDPVGLKLTGAVGGEVFNLDAGQTLIVDGAGGADTINGSSGDDNMLGGAGNDVLIGNAGSDQLDGGAGNDKMTGGPGDDNYVVDSSTDVLTEKPGEGSDSVQSSVTWTLAANFENLSLTGIGNINATGNAQGNLIEGNSGNNVLDGKAGADILSGGAGNDIYVVDNTFDFVDELLNHGTDLVQSSVSFTLADNVENLTLNGSTAIDGTGNGGANALLGNIAANSLAGLGGNDAINGLAGNDSLNGGAGADILTGGLGSDTMNGGSEADTFIFDAALSATNVDIITDFTVVDDIMYLSKSVFAALGISGQTLPTADFVSGAGATAGLDSTDRIIYNTTTGDLYYDSDGNGAAAAVKFATLTGTPVITENDLFVTT